MKKLIRKITTSEFDKKFDQGDNVSSYLDIKRARSYKKIQRVNIDFPVELLDEIDEEARKVGVARTALIKVWLAERLEQLA